MKKMNIIEGVFFVLIIFHVLFSLHALVNDCFENAVAYAVVAAMSAIAFMAFRAVYRKEANK